MAPMVEDPRLLATRRGQRPKRMVTDTQVFHRPSRPNLEIGGLDDDEDMFLILEELDHQTA